MDRRVFLKASAAQVALLAAAGAAGAQDAGAALIGPMPAPAEPAPPFDFGALVKLAQARAGAAYAPPASTLSGAFADLNYDQYRAIRFRRDRDPWADIAGFGIDLLPPGLIFHEPVQVNLLRDGQVTPLPFRPDLLEFDAAQFPQDTATTAQPGDMGWAGFRVRTPLNRPDVMDEFLVFQGASYFRAVAQNTLYGLSARGLAIDTGSATGEEFPLFTDFWLERPAPGANRLRIYAMLDSRSVAGAFRFDITPGARTVIDTRMALFPRVDLAGAGIAPLTSMFWFGPGGRAGVDDYRPAVHDSDGLQIATGAGQQIWRSLAAPARLQISDFVDNGPRGFGLVQRARDFDDFQDAEARYEARPSAWIEPQGDWGKGHVRLVEIPVENEFNDNIVAFWTPEAPLRAGQRHDFAYRLSFAPLPPPLPPLAQVRATRAGRPVNDKTGRSYVIDFDLALFRHGLPRPVVTASSGEVAHVHLVPLPEEGVLRLAFLFRPGSAAVSDLQAVLNGPEGALSETWICRWSR